QDRRVDLGGFRALALAHQDFDDALTVSGLFLGILGDALFVLTDRGIAIAHAQIKIADREICLIEIFGVGLDLAKHVDDIVAAPLAVVMHRQQRQKAILLGIVLVPKLQNLFSGDTHLLRGLRIFGGVRAR